VARIKKKKARRQKSSKNNEGNEKWLDYVEKMLPEHLAQQNYFYNATSKTRHGLKRWKEQFI
jgi:hypothetical protein